MKNHVIFFLPVILLVIILSACSQKKPSISEDLLSGDWYVVKGDVESYSFVKDDTSKTFTSYLHSRPFMYGTWKIEGQTLMITAEDGTTDDYGLTVKPDTLLFNDGEQIFTKTIPLEVLFPEIMILKEVSSEFDIPFVSRPQPVDFSWQKPALDSTMSDMQINLRGYETGLNCPNKNEARTRIVDYLLNNGFKLDTTYRAITEITEIIGYWNDDQLVTLSDIYSDTGDGEIDPSVLWIRSLKVVEK